MTTLLKSVNLPAELRGIFILDSSTEKSAFAATQLLITKKNLSPIAIESALETILVYAVVLLGRAYLRSEVRNEGMFCTYGQGRG